MNQPRATAHGTPSPASASTGRVFVSMVRHILAFAGWRVAGVATLAAAAAAAEGMGLLLLIPLLQAMGLVGGGAPSWPGAEAIARHMGLEGALVAYVILVAAGGLAIAMRGVAASALKADYAAHLRSSLHHGLTALEWRAFNRLRRDEAQHLLVNEINRTVSGVDFLLRIGNWAVEVPILLAVALRLSPILTAASLGLAAVCLVLGRPLTRRAYAHGQRWGAAWQALQRNIGDDLAGMRVIRGLGLEEQRRALFGQRLQGVRRIAVLHQRNSGLARAAFFTVAAVAAAFSVWFSVRVLALALGDTLVLMMAFARLVTAALRIQEAWREVAHALPAHVAVREMLAYCGSAAEPDEDSAAQAAPPPRLTRDLRIENVTFSHGGKAAPTLASLTATLPARALIAVVGPSGAGKSTLADLLLGLLAPDHGSLFVDGRELAGAARRQWRRRVGYVPQDSFLFHDSIRNNLAVAAPHAPEAALWRALEQAAAADFIRALPQGLDTTVGDRGDWLSGGQRQRVALARALLTEPDLLILDEATNALDSGNEQRILDTLAALRGQLTVLIIAHNPSTVRQADHVLVLKEGRVAAAGPWAEVADEAGAALERQA